MSFSNAYQENLDNLKWISSVKASNTKLPHSAAQKIKEILLDDQLNADEFLSLFNDIIKDAYTLPWKIFVYFDNLKDKFMYQSSQLSWLQILLCASFALLILFGWPSFYKKYLAKYPNRRLMLRTYAWRTFDSIVGPFCYFPPLVATYQKYALTLFPKYPVLFLFYPDFLKSGIEIYLRNQTLCSYVYIFGVFFLIRANLPRVVRYHLLQGCMIYIMQGIPDSFITIFFSGVELSTEKQLAIQLVLFCVYLSWILPGAYQAVTRTYSKNAFLREAIEVSLGRDQSDGYGGRFKWWDRDY